MSLAKHLDLSNPVDAALKLAVEHLAACYECLSASSPFAEDRLAQNSLRFAWQCVALDAAVRKWHIKPKLQWFQKVCEMSFGSRPASEWAYRDEDFGGAVAKIWRGRGVDTQGQRWLRASS